MGEDKFHFLMKECLISWHQLERLTIEIQNKQKEYETRRINLIDRLKELTNEIVEMMPALMSTFILKKDFKVPSAETARKRRERVSNMRKTNYSIATYLYHTIRSALPTIIKTETLNKLYRVLVLYLSKKMVEMLGTTDFSNSICEFVNCLDDSTFYQERKEMMWVLVFSLTNPPSIVLEPDFSDNRKADISRKKPKFDVYNRKHANIELYWLDYIILVSFKPSDMDTKTFYNNNPEYAKSYRMVIEAKNKSFVESDAVSSEATNKIIEGGDNLQQTTQRLEEEEQAKTSSEDEIANEESKMECMTETSNNDEEEDEEEEVVEKVGESDSAEDEDNTNDGNVVLKRQRTEHVDGARIRRQSIRAKTKQIPFSEYQNYFKSSHKKNSCRKQQTAAKEKDEDVDEDEVAAVMFNLSTSDALKQPTLPAVTNLESFFNQQYVDHKKECCRLLENTKIEEEIPLKCLYWKIPAEKVDGMRELTSKFLLHITSEVDELEEKQQARFICNNFKKKMSQYNNPKENGRFMSFLDIEWINENIPEFMEIICVIYSMFWSHNHNIRLGGLCVLKSYPNCGVQQFHLDYLKVKDESMSFACNFEMSFSLLFSLQDGTKIDLSSDGENLAETVELSAGDLFIMNANLCHRGCNYDKLNYRVFFVAESPDMPFKSNTVDKIVDVA
jgi:hypothetical protein